VPIYIEAIGETRGSSEIEVRARVEGFVESVDFKEGSVVAKGQLLYRIDPRPFQATVAQTKGVVAEAEAGLARAQQDVTRYEPLVAKNAISRQDYETAVQVKRPPRPRSTRAKASQAARADRSLVHARRRSRRGVVGKTEVYPGTLVGAGRARS
jgi:membrane fusion protein (multidrug efflux system)